MKIECDRANDSFEQIFEGVYGYHKPYKHMTADLKDRVALITGASGMIGGATAELMAASGAKIAIWDINDEAGAERVAAIKAKGGEAKYYHVNLGDRESIKTVFEQFIQDFGRIDILFGNGGSNWGNRKPVTEFDDEKFPININVNLHGGTYMLAKLAIPYMIKQGGGSIMFTSSVCGVTGLRKQCGFVASKFAISALTRSMALEYGKYGIRVNTLAPGSLPGPFLPFTNEGLWADVTVGEHYDENFENPQSILYDIAARRPAYPTDMAGLMLYLASDDASYTSGQVICVDGGWTAGFSGDY